MAHKTAPMRAIPYDTETIMTQVNLYGFVYRTSGNKSLVDVLVKAGLLAQVRGVEGRYEKRVKAAKQVLDT